MRGLPAVVIAAFSLLSSNAALAITGSTNCPSLANQRNTRVPAVNPLGQPTYLCSNANVATDPPKLGDLSPQGQMENMQICDSNCTYRPLFPNDPDSPLLPVQCGRQQNIDQPYAVNGSAAAQSASQGPPPPYLGTGINCQPLMIPQAPINIQEQKPPNVKVIKPKPSGSPSPSPAPSPH